MDLQELRRQNGFTQKTFSQGLNVSRSTVAMWETGRSEPRSKDIPKIAQLSKVPIEVVVQCIIKSKTKNSPVGE